MKCDRCFYSTENKVKQCILFKRSSNLRLISYSQNHWQVLSHASLKHISLRAAHIFLFSFYGKPNILSVIYFSEQCLQSRLCSIYCLLGRQHHLLQVEAQSNGRINFNLTQVTKPKQVLNQVQTICFLIYAGSDRRIHNKCLQANSISVCICDLKGQSN